jgi:hypothetical protein
VGNQLTATAGCPSVLGIRMYWQAALQGQGPIRHVVFMFGTRWWQLHRQSDEVILRLPLPEVTCGQRSHHGPQSARRTPSLCLLRAGLELNATVQGNSK